MTGENQTTKVGYNHSVGLSALLGFRGQAGSETDIGLEIFRTINFQLALKDNPYGSNLSHPVVGNHARGSPVDLYKSVVMQRLVSLRRQFRLAVNSTATKVRDTLSLRSIWRKAIELEEAFRQWPELVAPAMGFSNESTSSLPFRHTFHYFPTTHDAIAWNTFWTIRVRVLRLVLDCSTLVAPNINTEPILAKSELVTSITECADQISDTIPFLTGDVDEQGSFRPQRPLCSRGGFSGCINAMGGLNMLVSTQELDQTRPGMRTWALERLYQLGDRSGLKQAQAFARFYEIRIRENASLRNVFVEIEERPSPCRLP